ncbi:helix-turn-helix domain-containing protein [Streptomyces radicis]|uniref:XRE family transcriptional regulator n=1 Tax=Streptomyces radicis TaxID=1750517 RepID=A0A3A9WJZ1_9ACTN|nr:helix-turn-helix transcriptional regulator [Streptomyces radicis]RKN06437.1 XRE family transcriptional regulator [Streptomyces radicis]RKN20304.1 XRE family transcriptional regulator [Streptomyces radicis]
MPNVRAIPTLRRRRLGQTIRRYRNDAGITLVTAARAMGWDDSKLSRMENAVARLLPQDVAKLLAQYGVSDLSVIRALEELAKDAGKQGWWQAYGGTLGLSYKDYLALETDAESLHIFTPGLIPGLLQTGAYAREIIAAIDGSLTPQEVAALAEVRKTRQAILTTRADGQPLRLWAVIHEAALHQRFAGLPYLMRQQLRHLLDMIDLPNITIQVMPLVGTPHPGMLGHFEIVRFPHPWPTVVMLENIQGGHFIEGMEDVRAFEAAFERVVAAALSVDDSRQLIKTLLERNSK